MTDVLLFISQTDFVWAIFVFLTEVSNYRLHVFRDARVFLRSAVTHCSITIGDEQVTWCVSGICTLVAAILFNGGFYSLAKIL